MEKRKGETVGMETLPPVLPVRADNRGNSILVHAGLGAKDAAVTGLFFITVSNRSLNVERDLGIRDKGGKKDRVRMPTCRTENACNTKEDDMISHPDFTVISSIPDERTGKTTSTGDLAKVQRKDDFIVKILRNRVVKIHFDSYHNRVHGVSRAFGVGGRVQTLVGESPAFRLTVTIHYDNTKSLRIKQSDGKYVRFIYAEALFILTEMLEKSLL